MNYAGFWTRIMAQNIDILFSVLVFFILSLFDISEKSIAITGSSVVLIYYIAFEASPLQATPGKLIMKIKVTDKNLNNISVFQSIGRTLGKLLSLAILFTGFSMIEFNKKKMGLHDYIAQTRVVFKENV